MAIKPKQRQTSGTLRNLKLEIEVTRLAAQVESEAILSSQTINALNKIIERLDKTIFGDTGQNGLYVKVKEMSRNVQENNDLLRGDGNSERPGLILIVDRLQQLSEGRVKTIRMIWGAVVSLAVLVIGGMLKTFLHW